MKKRTEPSVGRGCGVQSYFLFPYKQNARAGFEGVREENNPPPTLLSFLLGACELNWQRQIKGGKGFFLTHNGSQQRTSWLLKWLKLKVYLSNSVGQREYGQLLRENQTDLFKKDKWVFRRANRR